MAVYEVFSHPELRRYKTHICSKATFVQIICVVLTFVPPILIAYRSQGFWRRLDTYEEQPDVRFKHELIVIMELQSGGYVTWSTYQNYNNLQMEYFRVVLIKSRETDENRDGKMDSLILELQMPLFDTEKVIGVHLLLFFDFRLYKFSRFRMESMAYICHSSPLEGSTLATVGDLRLVQKQPLYHKGVDERFNHAIINNSSFYAESYDLATIFDNYSKRNVSTQLQNIYPVWTVGRGANKPFIVKATVRYPVEEIQYYVGFWHLIKWGWVQYAAILVVFVFVFNRIKIFIYQNQIVTSIVERPGNIGPKPKMY